MLLFKFVEVHCSVSAEHPVQQGQLDTSLKSCAAQVRMHTGDSAQHMCRQQEEYGSVSQHCLPAQRQAKLLLSLTRMHCAQMCADIEKKALWVREQQEE